MKVKAEFLQLANPGFLNTSSSLIPCPYPESLSDSVVDTEITTLLWVREPCVLDWELYWVLMITTVGLGMVVLGVWLQWGRKRHAQERQWTNWHALGGCLVWVVVATDVVTDSVFNLNMLRYVAKVPLLSTQCVSLNGLYQPAFAPDMVYSDTPSFDYSSTYTYTTSYSF
jgi:hypothetical protein